MLTSEHLSGIISQIKPLNEVAMAEAKTYLDSLAKPPRSLGRLEKLAIQLAGMTGKIKNKVDKSCIIIMCADNGVAEEGVASAPQSVTVAQMINFTLGKTGVAVLSKHYGADLMVVDVGVKNLYHCESVFNRSIRRSTSNIAKMPAMSKEEAFRAIEVGIEMADKAYEKGYKIIGTGEMGIGNTTTSSAITMLYSGLEAQKVVGRGGGITDQTLKHKIEIVKQAIKVNNPNSDDPIDVVTKVGGFDIAALMGVYLGCAKNGIPVVIDGFISAVAALLAVKLAPLTQFYLIPSHCSRESGFQVVLDMLKLEPLVNLDLALGEGSGCPFAFYIVDSACAVINNMATFEQAEINDDYLEDIR